MQQTQWTAEDLLDTDFAPIRWAVSTLIPEGITLLAGRPKSGKTWFAMDCAVGVASGTTVLDEIIAHRGDVLFCALEDSARRFKERMKASANGRDPSGLTVHLTCPPVGRGGVDQIEMWIRDHPNAGMIIIDVLEKIRGDHRGYRGDYETITALRVLSDKYRNIPIVLLTHMNKEINPIDPLASVSGSTGLVGAVDTVLIINRPRGSEDAILTVTGRDVRERELGMTLEDGRWHINPDVVIAEMPEASASRVMVLTAVREGAGQVKPADIAQSTGLPGNNVRQLLFRLKREGLITRDGGRYAMVDRNS